MKKTVGERKIRLAKKSDLPAVNAIRRQVHLLHAEGRPDIFRRKFGKKLAALMYDRFHDASGKTIVAEKDGTIVGFAVLEIVDRPKSPYNRARRFLRVTEFGVDKACRREGIGAALLTFVKQYAAKKNFDTVELDVWEFNEGALRFYEAQGFSTYRRYMECKL